jgi:hypothetical protein
MEAGGWRLEEAVKCGREEDGAEGGGGEEPKKERERHV